MLTLLLLLALPAQDADAKVVDGRTEGVFHGWSPVLDLWGNTRRGLWTLRKDGAIYWGAPAGSFESFAARALTADEKKESGTYSIDGAAFPFTYRDGSKGEGKVKYEADGTIKVIEANALRYIPIRRGLAFDLTGTFTRTVTFQGPAATTYAWSSYTFFKHGGFVKAAGDLGGSADSLDAMRRELSPVFGADAKEAMGTFAVKGSGLTLTFDSGRVESLFVGQLGDAKSGEVMILIGGGLFEGVVGKAADDTRPTCKAEHFVLRLPAGWSAADQEVGGQKIYTLSPGENTGLAILAFGADVGAAADAPGDAEIRALRELVGGWIGAKLAPAGDVEKTAVDGGDGVIIPMQFDKDGTAMRADAIYVVKGGRALLLVAVGTVEAAKARTAEVRSILGAARFAVDETVKAENGFVELRVPKAWKVTKVEQEGSETVMLGAPGAKEGEFFAAIAAQPSVHKSAKEAKAVAWLKAQVEEAIPGLEIQGTPAEFAVDGEPAVSVKYAGKTGDGDVVVVVACAVVKHGRVVLLLTGGKEAAVTKHSGAARRAFESARIKRGK